MSSNTGYFAQFIGEPIVYIHPGFETVISTFGAHNLTDCTPILIQYVEGLTGLNGNVFKIKVTGPSTFTIPFTPTGSYVRGGTYSIAGLANHYLPS